MFTGLVRALGEARRISPSQIQIQCSDLLEDMEIGDSIAVDGICLTVTRILADGFMADVSPETLRRSTLGSRAALSRVNLEPSLRVGDKIGGHFVSGHIDGTGELLESRSTGEAWELSFRVPEAIGRLIVPKGSVAVNGVSLTVAQMGEAGCWFQVAVIPHSFHSTNLSLLQVGEPVNVEGDLLGKYVEKLLPFSGLAQGSDPAPERISLAFLTEHGYG